MDLKIKKEELAAEENPAPPKLTVAGNVILTLKILAAAAAIVSLLWLLDK